MMTLNCMIWLTSTKNILILKLVENTRSHQIYRFNFGQFFTNRTIIAEPLPDDLADELNQPILEKQKEILTSFKEEINSVINPSKPEDYDLNLTEADIFNSFGITKEEYYNALSISIETMICTFQDH